MSVYLLHWLGLKRGLIKRFPSLVKILIKNRLEGNLTVANSRHGNFLQAKPTKAAMILYQLFAIF